VRRSAQDREPWDAVVVVRKGSPFDADAMSWLQLLVPHLHAAVDLAEKLVAPLPTTSVAAQLARLFPTPCLLTDDAARCIERNDAFGRVLEALSGSVAAAGSFSTIPSSRAPGARRCWKAIATAASQSLLANAPTGNQWKVHIVPVASVNSLADATPRHLMFAYFEKFAGAQRRRGPCRPRGRSPSGARGPGKPAPGQTAKVIARGAGLRSTPSAARSPRSWENRPPHAEGTDRFLQRQRVRRLGTGRRELLRSS
jgi:hypothetical protein